jgi:hypothetical protein
MSAVRRTDILCLHDHAHPSLGWRLELNPDHNNPFQPTEVFVTTEQLNHANITPRHGLKISFVPRDLLQLREPQKPTRPTRLHADPGLVAPASGKNKKSPR